MKLYTGNPQDIPLEGSDTEVPRALLESQLQALSDRLRELGADPVGRAQILLEMGRTWLRMEERERAWDAAREAFDAFLAESEWEAAIAATEVLFLCEQPLSFAALGQGIWLAVTFPVDPHLTVEMLRHVVDETPDDADGAAVAAAAAHYVADLRTTGQEHANLTFYTAQMLSSVARRHSQVESEEDFAAWIRRLELDDPEKFLIRLRNVLDVLVQDDWWVDREAVHATLPVN